jgi:hypothetical protein
MITLEEKFLNPSTLQISYVYVFLKSHKIISKQNTYILNFQTYLNVQKDHNLWQDYSYM